MDKNPGKKSSMKVVRAAAILAAFGAILAFHDDNMVASKVLFSAKYRSKALRWASDFDVDQGFQVPSVVLADDGIQPLPAHFASVVNQRGIVRGNHHCRKQADVVCQPGVGLSLR